MPLNIGIRLVYKTKERKFDKESLIMNRIVIFRVLVATVFMAFIFSFAIFAENYGYQFNLLEYGIYQPYQFDSEARTRVQTKISRYQEYVLEYQTFEIKARKGILFGFYYDVDKELKGKCVVFYSSAQSLGVISGKLITHFPNGYRNASGKSLIREERPISIKLQDRNFLGYSLDHENELVTGHFIFEVHLKDCLIQNSKIGEIIFNLM